MREPGPGFWGYAREHIEDGCVIGGRPEKVVSAMDGDIQAAGKLLAELREAYRRLPQHVQADVAHLLRESTLQAQPSSECAS